MGKLYRKLSWKKDRKLFYFLAGAFLLLCIDFATKWIIEKTVSFGQQIALIPNFLYITKSYNVAIAFSLGNQLPMAVGRSINIIISIVMSIAILWYWMLHDRKFGVLQRVTAMLLASGAVGNLIDRAFYWQATTGFDGVIDWIQFYLGGGPSSTPGFLNPFATFNLADAYLVIGVVMVIVIAVIDMFKDSKGKPGLNNDPRLEAKEPKNDAKTDENPIETAQEEQK